MLPLVSLAIPFFASCCGSVGSDFWKRLNIFPSDVQMVPGEVTEPFEGWGRSEPCTCCRGEESAPSPLMSLLGASVSKSLILSVALAACGRSVFGLIDGSAELAGP